MFRVSTGFTVRLLDVHVSVFDIWVMFLVRFLLGFSI